jgi:hypothetical protein
MGRPKKVKRAYHRKIVQNTEETITPVKEVEETAPIEEKPAEEDEGVFLETDIEDKMPSLMPGDLTKMFAESLKKSKLLKRLNPEMLIEVKIEEEPIKKVEPQKKQHETFFNMEQGKIELEEAERLQKEVYKKRAIELAEKERLSNAHKPKLVCHFCNHTQYSVNSKDVTSAWCEVCGRCFQAVWQ